MQLTLSLCADCFTRAAFRMSEIRVFFCISSSPLKKDVPTLVDVVACTVGTGSLSRLGCIHNLHVSQLTDY